MELPTIFVFTHDAMGDGEDGPTHQPVEHLASLRAIPGLVTLRPGDANEVVEAYRYVMHLRHEPAVLALSRQPLPTLDRSKYAPAAGVAKGAYVLADAPGGKPPGGDPQVILIASGSEVCLAVEAHEKLAAEGIRSRMVSMPSWDIFDHQPKEYRESVLPPNVKARIAIEQASTFGWERYVGDAGRVIGMQTFGASAPLRELQKKFGFHPDRVVATAKELLGRKQAMTGAQHRLVAGDLAAIFLPDRGMLGASLQHRGEEILRRVDDLEPMTAPTSALTTGRSLPLAGPGERFSAAFRIRVEDAP
jgi:transketolase